MQALPFALAAAGLLLAALLGDRASEIEILGVKLKPLVTKSARGTAGAAGGVCLAVAYLLSDPWPPGPDPGPSPSPAPSQAVASATPSAEVTPTASPTASPSPTSTIEPTASPTPSPTVPPPTPTPVPTPKPVAKWALNKADELKTINVDLGAPSGSTSALDDGWSVQGFENGILYRNPDKTAIAIRGSVYERWRQYGVANKPVPGLGYPNRDQQVDGGGFEWQRFATGAIQCTPDGCFAVLNPVYTNWRQYQSKIGYPKGETVFNFLSSHTDFEHGTISVNMQGEVTVCGPNGENLEGSGTLCGGPPVIF